MTEEDEEFNRIEREAAMRKAAVKATVSKREWVGLVEEDWQEIWDQFDDCVDEMQEQRQTDLATTHGGGHYYLSPDDDWELQKLAIRQLVNAKLKEKNI